MRVLVIGVGSIGTRHIANLRTLGVKDITIWDTDPRRCQEGAERWGVRAGRSLEAAYAAKPDAVVVCVPTSLHLPLARGAIQRGCDVFVEKPLSHTLDGVEGLTALARELGRVLMVGYNLRFSPQALQVNRWLSEERVGRVVSARLHCGSYLPARHPWEDYRQGYGARQALGGGVILDAIHEIDYALWFFGLPEHVYCVSGRFSNLEIDTEDTAEILLTYAGGRVVSLHLDYLQRPHQRWCEVIGSGGWLRCDFVSGDVRLFEDGKQAPTVFNERHDPNEEYLREMEHFLACAARRALPPVDGVSARWSLEVALAAKRSAAEGRPIDIRPREDAPQLLSEGCSP